MSCVEESVSGTYSRRYQYMDEDGRYLHIVLAYSTSTWMMMEDTWMRIVPSLRVRVRVRVEL
jgi:hypothetical protein